MSVTTPTPVPRKPVGGSEVQIVVWVTIYAFGFSWALEGFHVSPDDPYVHPESIILLAIFVFVALTWMWLFLSGDFWRRWFFWRKAPVETVRASLVGAYCAWVLLTVVFAAITYLLWREKALTPPGPGTPPRYWYSYVLYYYLWNFLDAIPALKVPATLNLQLPIHFTDYVSGVLLLVYKVLVIIPVVAVLKEVLRSEKEPAKPDSSVELATVVSPASIEDA